MPEGQDDTSTDTTDTETADDTSTGDGTDESSLLSDIAAQLTELGLEPGQLKGRLEASKKWEKSAKANTKKLAELETSLLSDNEKALAEAKAAGRTEAQQEIATKLAQARIETALTGIVPDPAAIAEDLNLAAYVTETGDVDAERVAALKAKYVDIAKPGKPAGDADGGARGTSKPGQLTRADLASMTPKEIEKARTDGRLNDLLGVS